MTRSPLLRPRAATNSLADASRKRHLHEQPDDPHRPARDPCDRRPARAAVVARRIANLVREYSAERAKLLAEDRRQRGELARRLSQLGHRIRRRVEAIADGTATRAIHEQLIAEEAERAKLGQELAWLEARARTVIELHPRAIAQY